jgi:hypothetical protein
MCCGHSRLPISNAPRANSVAATSGPPSGAIIARPGRLFVATKVEFEYGGATALTVVSPMTGNAYRFTRPGARIVVDPGDASWLAFVPNLRRV